MKVLAILLLSVLLVAGCVSQEGAIEKSEAMDKTGGVMDKAGESMGKENMSEFMAESEAMKNGTMMYSGNILAGSMSPVIDFNQQDYQVASQSGKLVVLYFYANWCPVCRAEVPQMYSAFSELNNPSAIAFRVNFNDDQTDISEMDLARQFGVPYQHTKVFVKSGRQLLKNTEGWDKSRYLLEVSKALSVS